MLATSKRGTRLLVRCANASALPRLARSNATARTPTDGPTPSTSAGPFPAGSSASAYRHGMTFDAIPTPLAPGMQKTALSQHTAFPASSVTEQLIILEACLATGHIVRAKKMFSSIRKAYNEEAHDGSKTPQSRLRLSDIVPVSIHTSFLRVFFRQALIHGSGAANGAKTRKRAYVSEAWEWLDMLLREEHLHGKLDDSAWAVFMKGLVATKLTNPQTTVSDPAAPHLQPISHLYSLMRSRNRSLEGILQDGIFSHAGIAGLNDHPAMECAEELASVLADKGEMDALAEVEEVRQRLAEGMRYRAASADAPDSSQSGLASGQAYVTEGQSGSRTVIESEKLVPARRSEDQEIPFRLGSLLGNLDTISGQKQLLKDPYVRQDLLEESAYDAAKWQTMHESDQLDKLGLGVDVRMKSDSLQGYMSEWLKKLAPHIAEQLLANDKASLRTGAHTISDEDVKAILSIMNPEKLAFITIVETLRLIGQTPGTDGVKATRAIIMLGRAVEEEFGADAWQMLYPDIYEKSMKSSRRPSAKVRNFMKEQGIAAGAANVARQEGYGDEADDLLKIEDAAEREAKMLARDRAMPWTQKVRAKVGGFLLKALLEVTTVTRKTQTPTGEELSEVQPAYFQTYQFYRGNKIGVIKLNPSVSRRLDKDILGAFVYPRYLPMLVPPRPWTRWNSGGYRIHPTEIMRIQESPEQMQYIKLASEQGHLNEIYAALDVLGQTAWTINKPVFDVITRVWNSGEALADIPVDKAESAIPDPIMPSEEALKDPRMREAYRVKLKSVRNARTKAHSQRCNLNYKLEIARAYLGETFYFPHNVDFRGRAYPIPPNLSHIGDDISRGLLMFAEGRKIGSRGLTWLRIQIANCAGFDKASFADREAFTKERMADVMDSADKPLEGRRWWLKADDPWQCLAACIDLTNALRSPNPEEYVSHLPVQQDGTCNGLQHYAALGGDSQGATQVNLSPGEKPADVYTAVAKLVNKELEHDIVHGTPEDKAAAEILIGKVTRKVVKQTVMTTVYGVTFIGAKNQIQRQLKDRGDVPIERQFTCAKYLAHKVLSSIGGLFQGASAIQIWLALCARLIGKSIKLQDGEKALAQQFKEPMASVMWTTPLGLPVVQPYRRQKKAQINTALQSVFITDPNTPTQIDPRAQATAFPPNYVHSLDATHMMMTAIECKKHGLAFASVHDSYWTHACDVDRMSELLRECFIRLHSQDLLGNLRADFQQRYADFVVRKSQSTTAAERMSAQIGESKKSANRFNLKGFAKDLGKATGLPPLAVAAEQHLLEEASEAIADSSAEADEQTEANMYSMDDSDSDYAGGAKDGDEPVQAHQQGKLQYFDLPAILPEIPPRGDFDLEHIRDSPYFFS